jgi:hypothetical protein
MPSVLVTAAAGQMTSDDASYRLDGLPAAADSIVTAPPPALREGRDSAGTHLGTPVGRTIDRHRIDDVIVPSGDERVDIDLDHGIEDNIAQQLPDNPVPPFRPLPSPSPIPRAKIALLQEVSTPAPLTRLPAYVIPTYGRLAAAHTHTWHLSVVDTGHPRHESGAFHNSQRFVDFNSNGQWNAEDLWARLGDHNDQPAGDWDGDRKGEIVIFGREWAGDPRAIANEPGRPDSQNPSTAAPKNLPSRRNDAASGRQVMQLTAKRTIRADLTDSSFHVGQPTDVPRAGDWNGDNTDEVTTHQP